MVVVHIMLAYSITISFFIPCRQGKEFVPLFILSVIDFIQLFITMLVGENSFFSISEISVCKVKHDVWNCSSHVLTKRSLSWWKTH